MKRWIAVMIVAALTVAGCGGGHSSKPTVKLSAPLQVSSGQAAMGSVHPPGWGTIHPKAGLAAPLTLAPRAEQYDTVTLSTVPVGAHYLAGYTAGFWPTYGPLTRLSWHPSVKSIAISVRWHAECLDVEPGDASPSQAAAWWRADRAAGFAKPCIYSSYWEFVNQVIPNMNAAGIPRSAYWAWDADYVYFSRIDSGFDCTQWTDKARGLNLDESTCTLAFLGGQVTPAPKPKPPADPLHYSLLTPTERSVVLRYDGARKHLDRYRHYVGYVLMPELGKLAHTIWLAHQHGGSWAYRHRGARFQALYRRSLGQQITK